MKSLKSWIPEAERIKALMEQHTEEFFRDPNRPIFHNDSYFYSPADGIVLYTYLGKVKTKLFDIKGKPFTIKDLIGQELDGKFIVVGIFMTAEDCHINRMPYSGFLKYWQLPPIKTKNLPMLHEEEDLLKGILKHNDMEYLFYNERVINKIRTKLGFDYWVVQIADFDIDVITPFFIKQNCFVFQNERFSMIRFGSQLDLIVPVLENYSYKFLVRPLCHVQAGLDALVEFKKK